ncbi:MAG: hypothetical protein JW716_05190 [Candidatus Aenigmarchaeota archaeon]|nr:hypothetical protein [Candidatus Aenigmarchaeota archaeon]
MAQLFSQDSFNQFIMDNNVVGFFPQSIKLKSGRMSNWYVNWRNVSGDVYSMEQLADYVIKFTRDMGLNPDCFYGVPEGATKLGMVTQYEWARQSPGYGKGSHPFPMGRAKPKEHGAPKDRYFVGEPKGGTIITEDVTTTGGSLLSSVTGVKENEGSRIISAFGLTNRMELTPVPGKDGIEVVGNFSKIFKNATGKDYTQAMSVQEALAAAGVPYHALANARDLLPEAYARLKPGENIKQSIEHEFRDVGIEEIKL